MSTKTRTPKEPKTPKVARQKKETPASPVRIIKPRTKNQQEYLDAIFSNTVILCTGPAGSGKTLLAASAAVRDLYDGRIEKIVLTKPIVEAGENLGFLPGDMAEKVDPHLRPLYDCLEKCLPKPLVKDLLAKGIIEICPFAFMRGRTFENATIVADECQNASYSQLKLLLTRIGEESKLILTADMDQIDITEKSGMIDIPRKIANVEGVACMQLKYEDVQRSRIVADLVRCL